MVRLLYTHPHPYSTAAHLSASPDRTVITASQLAARALNVPHQPLIASAVNSLEQAGWRMASPLTVQSVFHQAVQNTVQSSNTMGLATAWLPSVRSLLNSHPDFYSVSDHSSARTRQLLQIAQQFQQALHQNQLFDSSETYWQALKQLPRLPPRSQQVLIYGYINPRLDELTWIDAIAIDNSIVFIPASDTPVFADARTSVKWLLERGWELITEKPEDKIESETVGEYLSDIFTERRQPALDTPDGVHTYHYSTVEAEMRGTLAQVKTLLNNGTPAQAIAVIVQDERFYGPKLMDIAWEYGVPLRALYSTPLMNTRLGRWLMMLFEVIHTGWPFETTAKLLSHPLCSNPEKDFWATVRRQHPVGFSQWQAIAHQHLEIDLSFLSSCEQERTPTAWVQWWQSIFQLFNLRQRCARWARESIAFNTLSDSLGELAQLGQDAIAESEFRQTFHNLLQTLTVLAQPGRGGVELHQPSFAGGRFHHLFVMGMAEGVLPATVNNDPVLDFFERQSLQQQGLFLPSAAALTRREALFFSALLQSTISTITFSYAKLSNRQEQLPSPYLSQMRLLSTTPPCQIIASLEEWRRKTLRLDQTGTDPTQTDRVLAHAQRAYTVEQNRESSAAPDEYDGIIGVPFDYSDWTFSVSQLNRLGQCPFKWFANTLLKLGPPVELENDLSPSQVGQLYHKVLELILAEKQHNPNLDITDTIVLEEKFAIAERAIIPASLTSWMLRRHEHLHYLRLALADPQFLPDGSVPLQLETKFSGNWQGLTVQGRVDRIDRTKDGLALIDYKTGKSRPTGIKDSNGNASIDLQLPLYQEAAARDLFPDEAVASAYYYSIRSREKIIVSANAPQHELPMAIARCKTHLDQGHYPVQPDNKRKACKYCDFDALCRQGDRLKLKENTHGTN